MTTEQTTPEVVEPTSGAAPETAAATTDTTATTETSTAKTTADQATEAAPDTKTESETTPTTETTNEAKPAETAEADSETKPADRVVPHVKDYVLPEGVPEYVAQFASENDMTQEQLDATLTQFSQFVEQADQGKKNQLADLGMKHVETWGKQKDYNLSLARRALSQNDPDGKFKALLEETGYTNHPVILDFFLSIGSSMKEGGFLKGANNTQSKAGLSAAQSLFGANHPSAN